MKIIPGEQYDDLWWHWRRGRPSASEAHRLLTPVKMQLAAASHSYLCQLIGDITDPQYPRKDEVDTAAMRNGRLLEPEARRWYEFEKDCRVDHVSLCLTEDERFCCSPDGLIGFTHDEPDEGQPMTGLTIGCIELKCPARHTHVAWLLDGEVPAEHLPQCHMQLLVTGAQWVDFMSYCPGLPPLLKRVEPGLFTEALGKALEQFHGRYVAALQRIRELEEGRVA